MAGWLVGRPDVADFHMSPLAEVVRQDALHFSGGRHLASHRNAGNVDRTTPLQAQRTGAINVSDIPALITPHHVPALESARVHLGARAVERNHAAVGLGRRTNATFS